jgi:ligand-binding SRPBCC domain-containing protein
MDVLTPLQSINYTMTHSFFLEPPKAIGLDVASYEMLMSVGLELQNYRNLSC